MIAAHHDHAAQRRSAVSRSDWPPTPPSFFRCQDFTSPAKDLRHQHQSSIDKTMATLPRRLLLQSRQCPSWIRPRSQQQPTTQWHRPISSTTQRPAKEDTKEGASIAAAATPPAAQDEAVKSKKSQTPEQIAAAQLSSLVADLRSLDPAIISDALRKGERGIPFGQDFNLEKDEDFYVEEDDKRKIAAGFWAEGEESMGPDEDYYGDDITSHGHGELQQHRDMRHYARLIAWEMPLLNRMFNLLSFPHPELPRREDRKTCTNTNKQNSQNPTNSPPPQPPSASATPPTSTPRTPQPTKSS